MIIDRESKEYRIDVMYVGERVNFFGEGKMKKFGGLLDKLIMMAV